MNDGRDSQDERDEPAPRSRSDGKQLVSTGALLAAVLAILAAGAVLRAEKSLPMPAPARAPAKAASPVERDIEVTPAAPVARPGPSPAPPAAAPVSPRLPSAPPPATGTDLERRALRDRQRLSQRRGSFTAQVAVTCKAENTRRLLREAGGSERLFLIPQSDRERTCYRICWGVYPTAREAAAAADLPAFLRRDGAKPNAKAISEIAP